MLLRYWFYRICWQRLIKGAILDYILLMMLFLQHSALSRALILADFFYLMELNFDY